MKQYVDLQKQSVHVQCPNGEVRLLSPGQGSVICKAVIEDFASRYLHTPGLVWLSDRRRKVVDLIGALGMRIETDKNFPADIVLVDTGSPDLLMVFVEVVATDGQISQKRKEALLKLATDARFDAKQIVFLTAFADRGAGAYRKAVSDLALGSFVWFASEPEYVIALRDGRRASRKLWELL